MSRPTYPNNGVQTDQPYNDPVLSPFLGLGQNDALDLGDLPEETAQYDPQSGLIFTPQGPINTLAALRAAMPYIPIIPFMCQVRTVVLAQNVAQDIRIPDGVVAIILRGSTDYYVSNHGNAEIPADTFSKSMYKPDGMMFYTGGMKSLSVITPAAAGCIVTLMGYVPPEIPRYG